MLAEDLGQEIISLAFNSSGSLLAIGLELETWVLDISKTTDDACANFGLSISDVKHIATLDTGPGLQLPIYEKSFGKPDFFSRDVRGILAIREQRGQRGQPAPERDVRLKI